MQHIDSQISESPPEFTHPVDARYHGECAPLGVRVANAIIGFMGSWPFLIIQTILVGIWVVLNVFAWAKHFDPYPFILLNLAFSTQAAYAAPMILMASNVAAAKDRELWENDYATNQKAYAKIEELERQIKALAEQNHELLKLMIEQKNRSSMAPEPASLDRTGSV
jgi:uncharacterized membrane protein